MKTFIFLFILIVGFFSYIFFADSGHSAAVKDGTNTTSAQASIPSLENIEESVQSIPRDVSPKSSRTSQNLHQIASLSDTAPQPISEQMTFDLLKNIMIQINPQYSTNMITLNTSMRSLLHTDAQKRLFKQKLAENFNLSQQQIDENMDKNRLLWDWVNVLR